MAGAIQCASDSTRSFFSYFCRCNGSGDNIYFRFLFRDLFSFFSLSVLLRTFQAMGFFICVISMPFGKLDKKNKPEKTNSVNAF